MHIRLLVTDTEKSKSVWQDIPQSYTEKKHSTMWKNHRPQTVTIHQKDEFSPSSIRGMRRMTLVYIFHVQAPRKCMAQMRLNSLHLDQTHYHYATGQAKIQYITKWDNPSVYKRLTIIKYYWLYLFYNRYFYSETNNLCFEVYETCFMFIWTNVNFIFRGYM